MLTMALGACVCFGNAFPRDQENAGDREAALLLDLKKARADYQVARQKFENDTKLYREKALSVNDYGRSRNELLSKEVDYQKLLLRLISQQSYITVEKAVKYQDAKGDRKVKITLKSALEGNEQYLEQFREHFDVFTPEMRSGKVYNVYVSLVDNESGTIISSPYEFRVPAIDLGETATADFELLRDVEDLSVSLSYNGRKDQKNIYLKKDASMNVIDINSMQFSQEADLGTSAAYDLSLERFSSSDDVYRLMVVNLPPQITTDFIDENSKVSQIKFAQGVNTKKISLMVYLPDRDDEAVGIDRPIQFHVVALTAGDYEALAGKDLSALTAEELDKFTAGHELLEIIPRGKGKIEVRASSLYYEINLGDSLRMDVTVRNAGSRRLDNIRVRAGAPAGWRTAVVPDLIRTLEPEKEQKVRVRIVPSADQGVGAQEIRIKTEATVENRVVDTEDKNIRIQVNARSSLWGTLLVVLLIGGFVVGGIILTVKMNKR